MPDRFACKPYKGVNPQLINIGKTSDKITCLSLVPLGVLKDSW